MEECRVLVVNASAQSVVDAVGRHGKAACVLGVKDHSEALGLIAQSGPTVVFSFKEVGQTPEVLEPIFRSSGVKWVHLATTGIDHLPSWDESKLVVTNSAGTGGGVIAEYVMGQILARETGLIQYLKAKRTRDWRIQPRRSLEGLSLHLIGVGNIGKSIAARAKAFGMKVVGFARSQINASCVDEMRPISSLASSIGEADYVSVQVPLTPDTRNLLDHGILASMKNGAWLINVSRGGVVDEAALRAILSEGVIAGATLDVFETEPLPRDDLLWALDNVIVTPHMSGYTSNWEVEAASLFCENLALWQSHQPLRNVVQQTTGQAARR
jgi:phosphoglycerate dehydrogenase-like enzyme